MKQVLYGCRREAMQVPRLSPAFPKLLSRLLLGDGIDTRLIKDFDNGLPHPLSDFHKQGVSKGRNCFKAVNVVQRGIMTPK